MPHRLYRSPTLSLALLAVAVAVPAVAAAVLGLDLKTLAGVYSKRFQNGDVQGDRYMSENVLEIVPTGPTTAFVRADLQFFNGHMCYVAGVAHVEGGALVYREALEDIEPCVLRISPSKREVRLSDDNSCSYLCGARGGFDGVTFKAASRRQIPGLAGLKATDEFRAALAKDRPPTK